MGLQRTRARAVGTRASALDLGTGGGERFATIVGDHRGRAVATESWHVNVPVAAARLMPLGIDVVACDSEALPFADETFDLVLDRHEALSPAEVTRVLAPGGAVLTQQVWHIWDELNEFFPRRVDFGDHFTAYREGFTAAGLEVVDAREHRGQTAYGSLGDLVYMLCILDPYYVPDFDPLGSDLDALLQLEARATTADGLVMSAGNYVIEAHKPRGGQPPLLPDESRAPRIRSTRSE